MAEKALHVTMPDGSVWSVPAEVIAKDRAAFYAQRDTKTTSGPEYDNVYAEELAFTLEDEYELCDWAAGNMNWSDVSEFAVKVSDPPAPDYQEGWVNGPKVVVTK